MPADVDPSPQSIKELLGPLGKSESGALLLASAKVATCPEKAVPSVPVRGETEALIGASVVTKEEKLDVPPPGVGLDTVTAAVFSSATFAPGTAAWSCPALTKVVVRGAPFQFTTEEGTNPFPFTVNVKSPFCSTTEGGLTPVTTGTGLFTVNVAVPLMVAKALSLAVSVCDPAVIRMKPLVNVCDPASPATNW